MNEAPVLRTARLVLRPHRRADFDAVVALWSDPEVTRFIGAKPATAQECWYRLMRYLGMWPMLGFGYWAVCAADGGAYLGEVGFADFKRGLGPCFDGAPEAGWGVATAAAGRGIATEAMRAAQAWLDEAFAGPRCVCMIEPANMGSVRVALKLGYRRLGEGSYGATAVTLFERPACGAA
ncbi:MAG: GNAT family N-acetyltransferase [Alphaproteobacteria bacterium]|nr:GNAT family N-acetyltransferase [Alphaproteobacteria bacterium]